MLKGVLILSIFFNIGALKPQIQMIKSIGDNNGEGYIFFEIESAVMSKDKDLFVLDKKGYSISKYNWEGKFVKRVGQRGRGPGDFIMPVDLQLYNNKLYVLDFYNKRIAVTGPNLDEFEYYQINPLKYEGGEKTFFLHELRILNEKLFLLSFNSVYEELGRLCIVDNHQKIKQVFFNHTPVKQRDLKYINTYTLPMVGINHHNSMMLISFLFPANKIDFFIYDFSGKLIHRFFYKQDEIFQFPYQFAAGFDNKKPPDEYITSRIISIFPYKDYFLVFYEKMHGYRKTNSSIIKVSCLVFDTKGKLLHEIDAKEGFKFLYASDEGYLLAKKYDADVEKLYIFKLTL